MKNELVFNKAYGKFLLKDDIRKYLDLQYTLEHYDSYDKYIFPEFNIEVSVENNIIDSIWCEIECYWKDKNLIGMLYEDFLTLVGQNPDDEDVNYIPVSPDRGQNQKVYSFDSLGLMLWVWRKKIRTVCINISSDNDEDNES